MTDLASHPLADPDAELVQDFGTNRAIYRQLGQLGHNGLDFAAKRGQEVFAAAAGTVVHAGWSHDHPWLTHHAGRAVLIDHGDGFTGYAHLDTVEVAEGQPVAAGELIGGAGDTGTAGGVHLHFEWLPKTAAPHGVPDFANGYAGRARPELAEQLGG
jgi:murein DD-endopeptidase MepM/ murein hydrolase activator NlpD